MHASCFLVLVKRSVVKKKCSNIIIAPHEPLTTHMKVERLSIKIPSLMTIEQ